MFNKKFKVRVKHFSGNKYKIQYAHYYIIPTYYTICFWFEISYTSDLEGWKTELLDYKAAEEFAKKLKSIDDIRKWYDEEDAKEKLFKIRKKEYYDKNVPYNTKYF